ILDPISSPFTQLRQFGPAFHVSVELLRQGLQFGVERADGVVVAGFGGEAGGDLGLAGLGGGDAGFELFQLALLLVGELAWAGGRRGRRICGFRRRRGGSRPRGPFGFLALARFQKSAVVAGIAAEAAVVLETEEVLDGPVEEAAVV